MLVTPGWLGFALGRQCFWPFGFVEINRKLILFFLVLRGNIQRIRGTSVILYKYDKREKILYRTMGTENQVINEALIWPVRCENVSTITIAYAAADGMIMAWEIRLKSCRDTKGLVLFTSLAIRRVE
jgi:hypothetical protein